MTALNATLKIYEPDNTKTDNPRVYSLPLDHPLLDVTVETYPGQEKTYEKVMEDWNRVQPTL